MNPENHQEIQVHCAHDKLVDIAELVAHPRNPNHHPDKQVALLAKIIRHQGWRAPIVVSKRSGFIITGHGRLEAAKLLGVQVVPVNFQEFKTEADEWAHLIADNRIAELAEINSSELSGLLKELESAGEDLELSGFDRVTEEDGGKYTAKIDAPIYEPKNKKPLFQEMVCKKRFNEIVESIKMEKLESEISEFLIVAASRHILFRYDMIAEFYCHADKKTQQLMEESALVIIDSEKAMRLGYAKLKVELSDIVDGE